MATPEWTKNYFNNIDTIAAFAGFRIIEKPEAEEHILPCPNCGEDYDEMELKPDNICPKCLHKEKL